MMSTVLVTGNRGYIGTVLIETLKAKGYQTVGLDIDYFSDFSFGIPNSPLRQLLKDIRTVDTADLVGIDAIIHLAGLCNDPLGELDPNLTNNINFHATLRLAKAAKEAGVRRFVYASSQSMYGMANTDEALDEDRSEKQPLTAYARTKWEAELALQPLNTDRFGVVSFRPSTVFGASPQLRCDIVFNSLVASAYTTGRVEVKSDGTPWRPVVHVRDVCQAFIAGLEAPPQLVFGRSFNVGVPNGNYTVRELAEAAQRSVPGSSLRFTGEHGKDSRTYRVSFNRILTELKDYYKPEWDLDRGGHELVDFFQKHGFKEEHFRGRATNRLQQINYLIKTGTIDSNLQRRASV